MTPLNKILGAANDIHVKIFFHIFTHETQHSIESISLPTGPLPNLIFQSNSNHHIIAAHLVVDAPKTNHELIDSLGTWTSFLVQLETPPDYFDFIKKNLQFKKNQSVTNFHWEKLMDNLKVLGKVNGQSKGIGLNDTFKNFL